MKKRHVLVLTEAELGLLRAIVDEALGAGGLAGYRKVAQRALAKIDSARQSAVSVEDLNAYDKAAGQMIDGPDWADYTKNLHIPGSPWRARKALDVATKEP